MNSTQTPLQERLKKVVSNRSFWILVVVLICTTLLYYCTPQIRLLNSYPITRHAAERIIFIIAVISATFTFGRTGGLVTLALVVLLMLPRVFLLSPYPVDALLEVTASAIIGYLAVWMLSSKQRAVSRLRTINAVTAVLTQSLELEQILHDVLDRILTTMEVQAGAIYLLDKDEQGLTLVAHRNLPAEILSAQGLKSARMLALCQDFKYQLAMPLRSKGKINGLLILGHPEPCPTLRRELKLLTTIANEVGMVIENARLYQDITRQLQNERCVCKVIEEITSELELDKVLPKVMRIAEGLVGADGGVIALWDEERKAITYPYLHNLPHELAQVTASEGEGLSGEVMATGRPIVVDNYQTYAKAIPAFAQAGIASVVAVPIVSGVRTFGALDLFSLREPRVFSDNDVALLSAIGRQAGIAIENAYLYENMRFYARRITRAQESERQRIARELHDDTVQSLIVLSRRLENLTSDKQLPEAVIQDLKDLRDFTGDVIHRVRRFSQDLRPSILDDLGLLPALEELTSELHHQSGIQAEFRALGARRRLSSEIELTLFRIAQEALSNVRKHAKATKIILTVEFINSTVQMTVQDNGKGFTPPKLTEHLVAVGKLGLLGMYERARLIGGTITVESASGQGTKVIVKVPI